MAQRRAVWIVALWLCIGSARAEAAWFTEATERLGNRQPCLNSGCYSNYVLMADLDGDGDLDLAFANGGGYYQPGNAEPLAIYRNDGAGNFTEMNATALGGFVGRLRQIAVGDVDGDGDLDLLAADSWAKQPDALFINRGNFAFIDEGAKRLGTSSRSAGARFGDLDGDGDLDIALTDWGKKPYNSAGTARVYLNNGKGYYAELPDAVTQGTSAIGTGPIDIELFDADGDFDLDMLLASRKGNSLFFRNDGTGHFSDANADLPDQPGPYVYGPDVCDVDGDHDLDVWLDNGGANLQEQLMINDGKGHYTDESAARITGNPDADDNEVQCVDLDNDGDFDAVVASLSDVERTLINDGTGHFTLLAGTFPDIGDSTLGLDFGNVDGDGRLDAVTAQGEGGDFTNRLYLGGEDQPRDTRPPQITRVQFAPDPAHAGQMVVRVAVADRHTTDAGPRVRDVRITWIAMTGAGAAGKTNAHFIGGDLFRAEFPMPPGSKAQVLIGATDWAGNAGGGEPLVASMPARAPLPDATAVSPVDADTGGADSVAKPLKLEPEDHGGCAVQRRGAAPNWPMTWLVPLLASAVLTTRKRRGAAAA